MLQRLIQSSLFLFWAASLLAGGARETRAQRLMPENHSAAADARAVGALPADVPANLIGWYGGDGDARDFTGANDGAIIFTNTKFIVGKLGQALSFDFNGGGGGVQINSGSLFRGRTEGTIETWVRLRGLPVGPFGVSSIWVETEQNRSVRFGLLYNRDGQLFAASNFSGLVAATAVPQNEWLHVAAVHKSGEPLRLYVNGAPAASSAGDGTAFTDAPSPFVAIGTLVTIAGDDFNLIGDVDDASVYGRALSAGEIEAIYQAGTAGKRRAAATAAGTNVAATVRDATLTFTEVTSAGETVQTPLETASLPPLPQGATHTGLAYEISTTAAFSGTIDLCFNVPALTGPNFAQLRVLQLENGAWINRTSANASPRLCARTASLSQFAIIEAPVPTAAGVTVGGRVKTAAGRAVSRAAITLTDQQGVVRTTMTNAFGYYRFTDVPAGAVYVLSAQSKQYVFTPPALVLTVDDELADADFTAHERVQEAARRTAPVVKR